MSAEAELKALEKAEHDFMRAMGWTPVRESDLLGDWRHEDDGVTRWDRDKALERARSQAISEAALEAS